MIRVNGYNDFLFNFLLESVSDGTMPFLFSEEFLRIMMKIDHPIAKKIMNSENENKPITYIDVTEDNDKVSFTTSPKIIEYLANYNNIEKNDVKLLHFIKYNHSNNDLWNKYRSTIKVGKLVKKIFDNEFADSGKPGEDIESFVNEYKAAFDKDNINNLFELVSGSDIVYWYKNDNYSEDSRDTTLGNSCMAEYCDDYIEFYAKNEKIQMLILFEDDKKEKIIGRALVWHLDLPENRIFMDRIYTVDDYQVNFFIDYAKKNEWLYKSYQTYGEEKIIDPKDSSSKFRTLEVCDITLNRYYPYLDTLQYLDQEEKVISNVEISNVRLVETSGEPRDCEWSDRYNEYINIYEISSKYVMCEIGFDRYTNDIDKIRKKEDAIFIKYYKEWVPKDRYDEFIVTTTIGDKVELPKDDAVYLTHYNGWATQTYINDNMVFCDYNDTYYYKKDTVLSKKDGYLFKDDAIKVYIDTTKKDTDWIPKRSVKHSTYKDTEGDLILKKL